MDSSDALSRSLCCERRLNNVLIISNMLINLNELYYFSFLISIRVFQSYTIRQNMQVTDEIPAWPKIATALI